MAHDSKRIIDTANSFFLAADRSLEQRSLGPGKFQMLIVPAIVCRAFAVELYLKALLTFEARSTTGHDLSALFSKLATPTQSSILGRLGLTAPVFDSQFAAVSKAFVEWRYIYESQSASVDGDFLYKVAYAAKQEAETRFAASLPT